jgi:hypothetical protein
MQGSKTNEGFNIEYLETKTLYIAFGVRLKVAGMSFVVLRDWRMFLTGMLENSAKF